MVRFTALFLTMLTGFSGLVYEVAWQKYLATLLGSHSEATAAVLAIFLGGLSAGYALFGALTRRLVARARRAARPVRLLLVYGGVESSIGLFALLFPWLFGAVQQLSLLVPAGHPGLGFAFDVGLSALLIGPPTLLMGGTIPILTLALAGDLAHATRVHAWVYGFNTLGAFAGALAAAFALVPTLGLDGTLYAMASVNLLAGGTFIAFDRWGRRIAPDLAEPAAEVSHPQFASYAGVALLAGFAMMTLQTTLNRIGALAFGSSPFTFAMIVAVFVFCIALGSLAVSSLPRIPRGLLAASQWLLVALLTLLYLRMDEAPYWAHRLRTAFTQHDGAFYPYQVFVFASLLALLIVPIGLSGALLPLIFDRLRREIGDLGAVAGRLYAWNTLGSLLGALLGGYVLLIWLDLHHVYRIAVAALALGAAILTALAWQRSRSLSTGLLALPAIAALVALPAWSPGRLASGMFRHREAAEITFEGPDKFFETMLRSETVFYDDDPTSSVSVLQEGERNHSIVVNGKSDGNVVGDFVTMSLTGLVPALLAESHERCFVIGFGTGVTTGELAALEETREVDVAEISRGVIEAAPFFDYANQGASKNPKVKIHRGDAYRTLQKITGNYDLIVSEPSNPWVTGVEMLYSQEFLEAARSRLNPGGVYAQWFHLYEVDERSLETVLGTYVSAFPHVSVWFTQGTDLLILGVDRTDRALDVEALEARFERPDFRAAFGRARITRFDQLLAHELLPFDTLRPKDGDAIHTLRHPILSDQAARAFFRGRSAQVPRSLDPEIAAIGAANSLLRRYAAADDWGFPESVLEAALYETCQSRRSRECTNVMARWVHDDPRSERRQQVVSALSKAGRESIASPRVVAQVAALFGSAGDAERGGADGKVPMQRVVQATDQYVKYFHYAFPFDPEVIRVLWSRCAGQECGEKRRIAQERLGFELPPVAVREAAHEEPAKAAPEPGL